MIYIDSFSLSPSFFKVYDKGTLLDEFDGIHSEYILFCYILNRMLFFIKTTYLSSKSIENEQLSKSKTQLQQADCDRS